VHALPWMRPVIYCVATWEPPTQETGVTLWGVQLGWACARVLEAC